MGAAEYYGSELFLADLAREWMLDEAPKLPGLSPEARRQIAEYDALTTTEEVDLWDELEGLFGNASWKPAAAPPSAIVPPRRTPAPRPKPRTRRFRRSEGPPYWDEPAP